MTYTSPTNTRREWLLDHDDAPAYWTKGCCPSRPISLDWLVNIGAVLNVGGVPYPCSNWMADAWLRLADAAGEHDTQADQIDPEIRALLDATGRCPSGDTGSMYTNPYTPTVQR